MSKNIERFIIALIVIVLIIICIIGFLMYQRRGQIIYGIDETGQENEEIFDDTIKRVDVRNDYFTVQSCINKFYIYYALMYSDEVGELDPKQEQQMNANAIYDMLDPEYIEAKQITKNNITTNFLPINEAVVNVKNMYVSQKTNRILVYIADGAIREKRTGKISNFKVIVKLDVSNNTFTIIPSDYTNEIYQNTQEGEKIQTTIPEKIEKNTNNMYDYMIVTDEEYVNQLTTQFKEEVLYNAELTYNSLDKDYKEKKFENLEEFETYAKNNIRKHVVMTVDKYQKEQSENYTQYTLLDTKGNYYIFRETAPMQYTLILDTYTIDIPEFVKKYEEATPQEKVILNINKILLALNEKDYKYVYGKLADSFKKSTFPTYASFEEYIKNNFFERNKLEYLEFGNEGSSYYTYKVKITDEAGEDNKIIEKTIILVFEDETEFKISFNVN